MGLLMLGKGQTQEIYGLIKINGLMRFMGLLILRGKLKSEDSLDLMVFRAIYGLINFVGPLSEFSQTKGEGGKGKEKGPEIYRCCTTLSIVELPLARYGHNCSFLACSGQTLCIGSFWPSFCIAITIVDIPLTITS